MRALQGYILVKLGLLKEAGRSYSTIIVDVIVYCQSNRVIAWLWLVLFDVLCQGWRANLFRLR